VQHLSRHENADLALIEPVEKTRPVPSPDRPDHRENADHGEDTTRRHGKHDALPPLLPPLALPLFLCDRPQPNGNRSRGWRIEPITTSRYRRRAATIALVLLSLALGIALTIGVVAALAILARPTRGGAGATTPRA
jgi:hypothetical protein